MNDKSEYPFTEYGQGFSIWPLGKGTITVTTHRASWLAKRVGAALVWFGKSLQFVGEAVEGFGAGLRRWRASGIEEIDLGKHLRKTQDRMAANMLNLFKDT